MPWGLPARPDDVLNLPTAELALHLLKEFRRSGELWNRNGFLQGALTAYDKNGIPNTAELLRALGEAFDWLRFTLLLAADPRQSGAEHCYVTRRGVEVAGSPDGLALIRAADRLNVDLHPRIARRVRAQFQLGEFELAAFASMREVEIRVRELQGAGDSEIGVTLMRRAFGPQGKLHDPDLDRGESDALSALFAGAIGVFKNPPSHRQVSYADPTVAAEVVLLGDLLLRMLDAREDLAGTG